MVADGPRGPPEPGTRVPGYRLAAIAGPVTGVQA
jgi:hypothetical protein